tara:strand:+ start:2479 stop:2700 length:222 start_codon:yes stop_codon:yes gene_type:complete
MRIHDFLLKRKLSAREFAAQAGMPVSTLCRIINGDTAQPRIVQQKKIVKASKGLISFSDMWPVESALNIEGIE